MHRILWWWNTNDLGSTGLDTWTGFAVANGPDGGPWGMHMMWGSWGIGMMLMMLLFWAAVIVAIVFLIRWLVTAGSPRPPAAEGGTESALDILKKRYARGEISKQEFETIQRDIQRDIQ